MNLVRKEKFLLTYLGTNPRLGWLFYALVSFFILYPLVPDEASGTPILDLIFSGMLVFCAYAVSHQRKVLIAAVILSILTLLFWWAGWALGSQPLVFAGLAAFAIFFCFILSVLLRNIMKSDKVSLDTIYGAMSAYLLVGVTWSFFFAMVEMSAPGAFDFGPLAAQADQPGIHAELRFFSYYSLVTLSTLGYGDITPLAPFARSLSALEAITGQLFIAVLIARMVGTHIAQKQFR